MTSLPFTPGNAKQAALTFTGDTYQGLDAAAMSTQGLITHENDILVRSSESKQAVARGSLTFSC